MLLRDIVLSTAHSGSLREMEGSMRMGSWALGLMMMIFGIAFVADAVAQIPPSPTAPLDIVTVNDGSVLYSETIGMKVVPTPQDLGRP